LKTGCNSWFVIGPKPLVSVSNTRSGRASSPSPRRGVPALASLPPPPPQRLLLRLARVATSPRSHPPCPPPWQPAYSRALHNPAANLATGEAVQDPSVLPLRGAVSFLYRALASDEHPTGTRASSSSIRAQPALSSSPLRFVSECRWVEGSLWEARPAAAGEVLNPDRACGRPPKSCECTELIIN
jgi:hypothetical protein